LNIFKASTCSNNGRQFVSRSLNLSASFVSSNPIFYGTLLSVIFTVGKAAGGILFGVAFWTVGRSIRQGNNVKGMVPEGYHFRYSEEDSDTKILQG